MMDLRDYTVIYKDADRQILVNKSEFNYSLVANDGDAYTEILVSAEEIDNSMTFPEAEKCPGRSSSNSCLAIRMVSMASSSIVTRTRSQHRF